MNDIKIYNDILQRALFQIYSNHKTLKEFERIHNIPPGIFNQLKINNGIPNISTLEKLCRIFHVSLDYFILGHENWKGKKKFKSRLLNERIAELMGSTDLSTKENAKFMGCSENSLLNWLNGEHMPTTRSIQKICNCFQVSADDLLKYK